MRSLFALAAVFVMNLPAFGANGDLDIGFGTAGVARSGLVNATFFNGSQLTIPPVVQGDGKILICSTQDSGGPSGTDFFVARFSANGALDSSFSFDGKVAIDFDAGAGSDYCTAIALQSDGKIVVSGSTSTGAANGSDFAVARLNSDGTLDASFGGGTGKTTIGFDLGSSNNDTAYGLAIQPDGRIVVAGSADTTANGTDFAVVRLNSDGSRDTAFNLTGKVSVGFNLPGSTSKADTATSVAIDAAGNIVLGGYANKGANDNDFAAARLHPNGSLDANFDADGRATLAFDLGGAGGSKQDAVFAMTIQRDGKIVLAGAADSSASATPNYDMAVARLLPDGSPDAGFGLGGKVLVSFDQTANGEDLVLAVAEQGNGKLMLGGGVFAGTNAIDGAAVRLNANGSADGEFGVLGKHLFDLGLSTPGVQLFNGIAFQGTQIIVSGVTNIGPTANNQFDNVVVRLQNDLIFADRFE